MADKQLMKNLRLQSDHVITSAREDECMCHKEKGKNYQFPFYEPYNMCVHPEVLGWWAQQLLYLFSLQRKECGLYSGHSTCSSAPLVGWNICEKIKSGYVPEAECIAQVQVVYITIVVYTVVYITTLLYYPVAWKN